ncbi:Tetratricopeptide repeat [Phytophthora cactorum]|nr:Tetratricopeptide repeat [Phytophthora cactorum]
MLRLRRYTGVGRKSAARDLHSLPSAELRNRFLQFFEDQGHRVVPSASLVPPGGDHSLLFVNAGMVPFKQAFLGIDGGAEARGYSRATSAQRCVRAGGKHNDLDQLRRLLQGAGNRNVLVLLTQELRLPVDRLHVTVLKSDQEARRLWKQIAGLPDHKILELDENENFWAMGDSGPCGPCSEVFWDLGDHIADPDERFLELWNLVFMHFSATKAKQLGVKGGSDGILASIAVPDWTETAGFQQMRAIVSNEERAFEEMLRNGRGAIDKAFFKAQVAQTMLSGADAFRLYDTYGIPLDITQVLAEEKGLTVEVEGYDASSEFMGYDQLSVLNARVLDSWPGPSSKKGGSTEFNVILDRCPFFPEGGGQVGDRGQLIITSVDSSIRIAVPVTDTTKVNEDAIVLKCSPPKDMTYEDISALFLRGDDLKPTVEAHRALKAELGEHVTQAGSQVTSDRLRFDFAHFGAMSPAEMASVEARVNAFAAAELDVTTVQLPREEAERSGAICNFGDKYGDVVRVVRIGGGSVAAGTRRVEAVAGQAGARFLQAKAQTLSEVADQLLTTPAKVVERVTKMQKQMKQLESRAQALGDVLATLPSTPLASGPIDGPISVPQVELHALDLPGGGEFSKVLKRRSEFLAEQGSPNSVLLVLLGSQVACIANAEAEVHAGKLLQQVVKPLGGRGVATPALHKARFLQISLRKKSLVTFVQQDTVQYYGGDRTRSGGGTIARSCARPARPWTKASHAVRSRALTGMGEIAHVRSPYTPRRNEEEDVDTEDWTEADRFEAAKACFDVGEYLRVHHMLSHSDSWPENGDGDALRCPTQKTRFLAYYALYLAGEKAKEEMDLEMNVTGSSKEVARNLHRQGTNPHLKELYLALSAAYQQNSLDGFGLYLYAVVLKRLGYSTSTGSTQAQSSTPISMKTRHHVDFAEEQKRQQLHDSNASNSDRTNKSEPGGATTLTFDVTTRFILIESIRRYPWNWSAWMELAAHSPFMSSQALASYHIRDFDQSQEQFERLAAQDPHRMENMDVYSNVLYVKEDKTGLSQLAHRALKVEKYRPETCCIIGNYYSIKNKHDRAIIYFHRALKLDPNFLSAWTLIGHEYIEMKNTSAAIEAYRHAIDLNVRDYRAWYGLGQAYEILNMFLYSIYYYRKSVAIRPYDARMWCALGGCYEKLNKVDEALACFHRAVNNQDREGMHHII